MTHPLRRIERQMVGLARRRRLLVSVKRKKDLRKNTYSAKLSFVPVCRRQTGHSCSVAYWNWRDFYRIRLSFSACAIAVKWLSAQKHRILIGKKSRMLCNDDWRKTASKPIARPGASRCFQFSILYYQLALAGIGRWLIRETAILDFTGVSCTSPYIRPACRAPDCLDVAIASAETDRSGKPCLLPAHNWLLRIARNYPSFPFVESRALSWDQALSYLDMIAVVSAVIGFIAIAVSARISSVVPEQVMRARCATFGEADWLPMRAAAQLFPEDGEIVVGERYRVDKELVHKLPFDPNDPATWGRGGKAPLLTYKQDFDSTHMLFFAGSGGYKTTSNVVPTALRYTGPIICLDPSTEVAPMVIEHRRKKLRREAMILDPANPVTGFNVLDAIETSTSKEEDIVGIAHMLLSESVRFESSTGSYFQDQAHNLLTGLLAHVTLSPEFSGRRNLRSLRQIVSEPETSVLAMLREVQEHSESAFIRETLGVFVNMTEQTFSGVYSTASKDTQWLSLDNYAALVCGDSFKSAEIATGKRMCF